MGKLLNLLFREKQVPALRWMVLSTRGVKQRDHLYPETESDRGRVACGEHSPRRLSFVDVLLGEKTR